MLPQQPRRQELDGNSLTSLVDREQGGVSYRGVYLDNIHGSAHDQRQICIVQRLLIHRIGKMKWHPFYNASVRMEQLEAVIFPEKLPLRSLRRHSDLCLVCFRLLFAFIWAYIPTHPVPTSVFPIKAYIFHSANFEPESWRAFLVTKLLLTLNRRVLPVG
jgi:hypothetical protein